MTDTSEVTTTENVTKALKGPREVPFSSIHTSFASRKNVDVTRAAKLNRSYIRANYDVIVKQWPALRKSQKANRDSNRYPDRIPSALAKAIVTRTVKGAKK